MKNLRDKPTGIYEVCKLMLFYGVVYGKLYNKN